MSLRSPFEEHPLVLAQSRSCSRQPQSSLSMHGSSNCPPACLYANASMRRPAVQPGPHQFPCIFTRVITPIRMKGLLIVLERHMLQRQPLHGIPTFDRIQP